MKHELFEIPLTDIGAAERPSVTALYSQQDGSLLLGLSFCRPLLFRVRKPESGPLTFEDLKIESTLGPSGLVAISHGLRPNLSGDTAFAVLHEGFMPGFMRGGSALQKSGDELVDFLFKNDGGMGGAVRHSVVQIMDNEFSVRRQKEPGALLDVAHIGDFIFGLSGSTIWREPYLNSEKREYLRKDLGSNFRIHRDDAGVFWLAGQNQRVLRMRQTDIKSKPTVLKLASPEINVSAAPSTDGWLYATTSGSKELFRIRLNPVSGEEEMSKIASLEHPITGLVAIDREESPILLAAVERVDGAELFALDLVKPEDPELPPPPGELRRLGSLSGIRCVSSLTLDQSDPAKKTVFGGESRLGCGEKGFQKTRLVQISEL